MKRRGEGGVTLIEIAVVMAIVGIMALFMAPAIGEWIDNFRIRQAGREMSSDLQFAKMKAISSKVIGTYCTVAFKQDGYAYVVFPDYNNDLILDDVDLTDLDGDGDLENETTDIYKMALLNRNIAFDTTQGGGDGIDFPDVGGHPAVAFDPSGLPRDSSGRLTNPGSVFLLNTKNNKHQRITISPVGRISTNEY